MHPALARCLAALPILFPTPAAGAEPRWITGAGRAAAFPSQSFVVGFAVEDGADLERLKQLAAADVARQLQVRIQSHTEDVTRESNGKTSSSMFYKAGTGSCWSRATSSMPPR